MKVERRPHLNQAAMPSYESNEESGETWSKNTLRKYSTNEPCQNGPSQQANKASTRLNAPA